MTENSVLVCAVGDLADGSATTVAPEVTGWHDTIAVFHDGGSFYALDDTCTHEESSLSEGWIEDGEVECAAHQSRFDLATGAVSCLPATKAACPHRVEVRDGQVWVSPGVAPASAES
jgi:nitrite reductase/ring-hydroxylating ferredoxin subunit